MWPFGTSRKKLLTDKDLLGSWGQTRAEKFLKKQGHKIITTNYSCSKGEIDIITASDSGAVVFTEVKTRANEQYAPAESAITANKKKRLIAAAKKFIKDYQLNDLPLRFDVVIVLPDDKFRPIIRHYKNAFNPYNTK